MSTTLTLELCSRTIFYHLGMVNTPKSKIFEFYGFSSLAANFAPVILRKAYKSIFSSRVYSYTVSSAVGLSI